MKIFSALAFAICQLFNVLNIPTSFFENTAFFQKEYGTITEQMYEGYSGEWDVYRLNVNGEFYTILADDYNIGDNVTTWFLFGQPTRTVFGQR